MSAGVPTTTERKEGRFSGQRSSGLAQSLAFPLIIAIVSIIGASRTSFTASNEGKKLTPLNAKTQRVTHLIAPIKARAELSRAYIAAFNEARGGSSGASAQATRRAQTSLQAITTNLDPATSSMLSKRLDEASKKIAVSTTDELLTALSNAELLLTDWPAPLLAESGAAGDQLDESIDVGNLVVNLYLDIRGARIKMGLDPRGQSPDALTEDRTLENFRGDPAWRSFDDAIDSAQTNLLPRLNKNLQALSSDPDVTAFTTSVTWLTNPNRPMIKQPSLSKLTTSTLQMLDLSEAAVLNGVDELQNQTATEVRFHQRRSTVYYFVTACFVSLALGASWVTARRTKRHFGSLRNQAERDHLTGLLNRVGIRRRVAPWFAERNKPETIGALIIDVDNFKSVNDIYGHQAGDQILAQVAERLNHGIVPSTSEIARWGGDEFFVLLRFEHEGPKSLVSVAERLHKLIDVPFTIQGNLVSVGITIGGVLCLCGSCDPDDLFRAADRSLFRGKQGGRNQHNIVRCNFQNDPSLIA